MVSYSRFLSGIGSDLDRERAALATERNELRARVAQLEAELEQTLKLNKVLLKSQATRNAALQKARRREDALLRQLADAGVIEKPGTARPDQITYLGQKRQRQP